MTICRNKCLKLLCYMGVRNVLLINNKDSLCIKWKIFLISSVLQTCPQRAAQKGIYMTWYKTWHVLLLINFIILDKNLIYLSAWYNLILANEARNSVNTRKTQPIWKRSANTRFRQSGFRKNSALHELRFFTSLDAILKMLKHFYTK